jgi:thiol-disulfide isomerase/thioredoxin
MANTGTNDRRRILLAVMAVILAAAIVGAMVSNWGATRDETADEKPAPVQTQPDEQPPVQVATPQAASLPAASAKPALSQIVARARTWEPQFQEYIGKPAPEFMAKDLDGKVHKLSDYRGKDVLLVFWAMWCGPCKEEIPSLVKLRQSIPEDKLAIIAVSTDQMASDPIINNSMYEQLVQRLKNFAATWKMNYIVVILPSSAERPYSRVNSLPSAFFISPDGTIKLATAGLVPLYDIEAILAAEK